MGSIPGSLRSALDERQRNSDKFNNDGRSKNRVSFKKPNMAAVDSDVIKHDQGHMIYDSDPMESQYDEIKQRQKRGSYKKPMATVTVDGDASKQNHQRSVIYDSDPIESLYDVNQVQTTIKFMPKPPSEISPRVAEAANIQGEITELTKQSSRETSNADHVKRKRHRSLHNKPEKSEHPQPENQFASQLKPEDLSNMNSSSSSPIVGNEDGADLAENSVGNENKNVAVGNEDKNVAVGNEDKNVAVGNEDSKVAVGNEDKNVAVGNEDKNVAVGNEDKNVAVGNEDKNVAVGNEDKNVAVGNEDSKIAVGNEDNKVAIGNEDKNVAVGNEDKNVAVGNEDNKVAVSEHGQQDRAIVSDDESNESSPGASREKLHYSDEQIEAMKDAIYKRFQKNIEILGKLSYNVPSFRNALMHMVQDYFALKPKKGFVIKAEHKADLNRRIGNDIAAAGLVPIFCKILKDISKTKWLDEEGNYSEKLFAVFRHCQVILFNFSDCSAEIGLEIVRTEGFLEFVLEILKDSYQEHCDKANDKKLEAVLRNYIGILHNCSTNEYDECRTRLKSIHCTETLLLYLKNSQSELFRMSAISTIAEIVDEKESQLLQADLNGIKFLLARLNQALKHQQRRYLGWSATELGRAVGRLAVNDANKMMLVCRGALPLLVDMAKTGNEAEQIEAVHALWTLAFCKENKTLMLDAPDLIDTVTSLRYSSNKKIKKNAQGTLWTLREVLRNDSRYSKLGAEICGDCDRSTSLSHVMISYQWGHQGLLMQLKKALQARGYKVWMDVDYMEGSTLAAMAEAVEQSAAFLMSMSGKYKDSPNCRAEAEYAFQKRKRIIPLVLEGGYRADGWLGIILGTKLFYDFSGKYSFQSRLDALIKELGTLGIQDQMGSMGLDVSGSHHIVEKPYEQGEKATIVYKEPAQVVRRGYDERDGYQRPSLHAQSMVSETVKSWTSEQLEAWRKRHMLNSEHLKKLTGKHLYFLRNLRNEAPEFYYQCLVKQSLINLDLDDIIQFNEALENLELS